MKKYVLFLIGFLTIATLAQHGEYSPYVYGPKIVTEAGNRVYPQPPPTPYGRGGTYCEYSFNSIQERYSSSIIAIQQEYERALREWKAICWNQNGCYCYQSVECERMYRELEILYKRTLEMLREKSSYVDESYVRETCSREFEYIHKQYERDFYSMEQEYMRSLIQIQEAFFRQVTMMTEQYRSRMVSLHESYEMEYMRAAENCTREAYRRRQYDYELEYSRLEEEFYLKMREMREACRCISVEGGYRNPEYFILPPTGDYRFNKQGMDKPVPTKYQRYLTTY